MEWALPLAVGLSAQEFQGGAERCGNCGEEKPLGPKTDGVMPGGKHQKVLGCRGVAWPPHPVA